jgi:integrase
MRAGEALGLQWSDVDFEHNCIQIRRSAWYGKVQSTKSKKSATPITLPDVLAAVLGDYKKQWKSNAQGFLFTTRNGRPPSSNKVVEYQLWPILDALNIPVADFTRFAIASRVSSSTRGTLRKSRSNSSAIQMLGRPLDTFTFEAASLSRP